MFAADRRLWGVQQTPHEDIEEGRSAWRAAFDASELLDQDFETMSGLPLEPVYGPADWADATEGPGAATSGAPSDLVAERLGWPGRPPYTRGPYASMYRSKLWTMRLFAGFGTAEDTNVRFRELLRSGGGGLSVAFDLPTLMGRDSDDPHSEGEVGRCGVAVDTLADMEDLFAGIDLGEVTTSMTINSPAAILFAMYVAAGEAAGTPRARLGGTLQNDILKEYQAQKEYIFPPRPSMRLVVDVIRFCTAEMPRFHPVSVSGYHIREAGSTAVQELAFTLANGFAYVEAATAAGLDVDEFAPRLSFFFNAHLDFFEEIAKYRAARRIWTRWMASRYGAKSARSMQLRFHTQTAGVSLTAQQPEVNIVRTAIEALAGVLGGTQSLHTNSMDEVLALPTDKAARIALRTQQVLAHETGVANVADPLGGSWFVESLTDEMERRAEEIFSRIDERGEGSILEGVFRGIEENWFQGEIAESAYQFQRKVSSGRRLVVGVNAFTEGNEEPAPPTLQIGPEVDEAQRKRLDAVQRQRSSQTVEAALGAVSADAADPSVNLVPSILAAARAYATVGEIVGALASVFGRWAEDPVL
jgi:methylmalonyl-CoA mutase N-terminal domain/subunit